MAAFEVCQASGRRAHESDSLKIYKRGTLIISYASLRISFVILSEPGALLFFNDLIASSRRDSEIIEFSSFFVRHSLQGFSLERSGAVLVKRVDESRSRVSLGLSVYEPSLLRRELRLTDLFPMSDLQIFATFFCFCRPVQKVCQFVFDSWVMSVSSALCASLCDD